MRCLLVFAVVCAVAYAQGPGGHGPGEHGDPAMRLVADEVHALLQATPSLTVAECTTKCDAVFVLDAPQDETITDRDCAIECRLQIEGPSSGAPHHPTGEPHGPGAR
ncbi:hypothetical protein C0Q70_03620 [Pomacea canaliculata]|uniref:Uncharacterized protein n=1 Tax=Pomacea canaliculata TaxID=400727 RepID=A0A2T7PT91_POMCA|nr:uncharacterized protein LOC112557681 [Pomacea canaliculata]PVD36634.1 hypothetical protein C0Q70_03620 [Pomacea canaliculata]